MAYRDEHLGLTRLQQAARSGAYARALAGYVRWLAGSVGRLPEHVREQVAEPRNAVRANHPRAGNNVAQLMVGISCALEYARSIDAISEPDAQAWRERAWKALLDGAQRQESHHRHARPEQRFLELLMSAIGSGRAHVADRDGTAPVNVEAWGWRTHLFGTGDYVDSRWERQGLRVGWLDADALYHDRAAAFRAAGEMDVDNGIGVSVGDACQAAPPSRPSRDHQLRTRGQADGSAATGGNQASLPAPARHRRRASPSANRGCLGRRSFCQFRPVWSNLISRPRY
jgi:hypothetical protein